MSIELSERLRARDEDLPFVRAYHRIDGPGSSLDLREFQQALWRTPTEIPDSSTDPSGGWSQRMARTVAITIDTGTVVRAEPYEAGRLSVRSVEYATSSPSSAGV